MVPKRLRARWLKGPSSPSDESVLQERNGSMGRSVETSCSQVDTPLALQVPSKKVFGDVWGGFRESKYLLRRYLEP